MNLSGDNIISGQFQPSGSGHSFRAYAPALGRELDPAFTDASPEQIKEALSAAQKAFVLYRALSPEVIANFLEEIGAQIIALGDDLILRANEETALPKERLIGERGRTVNQLKMFAEMVREGSWVEAIIDRALPQRAPLPRPDLRRMLQPIGPVVVFSASNFPLAFSVAGGDTASALASGCPVIVKAHPGHPGTSELVAKAIVQAAKAHQIPGGVFSLLHGQHYEVGLSLVRHPLTKAVAFTGSLRGGRALFDAAAQRKHPIPVFAEMGSTNPVFLLPEALSQKVESIADGLYRSFTLGVGQFCTCPGIVVAREGEGLARLKEVLRERAEKEPPASMLTSAISDSYREGLHELAKLSLVSCFIASSAPQKNKQEASAAVLEVSAPDFLATPKLSEELFGPATILVTCRDDGEVLSVAERLEGQLTASLHGTPGDLVRFSSLVSLLVERVGRLIFDGFPTGVEVCCAMHHGGPYPATTSVHFTSVGAAAIKRFARPVCYQNAPQEALPLDLQDQNVRKIWRQIDNNFTNE